HYDSPSRVSQPDCTDQLHVWHNIAFRWYGRACDASPPHHPAPCLWSSCSFCCWYRLRRKQQHPSTTQESGHAGGRLHNHGHGDERELIESAKHNCHREVAVVPRCSLLGASACIKPFLHSAD